MMVCSGLLRCVYVCVTCIIASGILVEVVMQALSGACGGHTRGS